MYVCVCTSHATYETAQVSKPAQKDLYDITIPMLFYEKQTKKNNETKSVNHTWRNDQEKWELRPYDLTKRNKTKPNKLSSNNW